MESIAEKHQLQPLVHKVGQDPDHSTCMYGYNARHNNTGVLPTVVHLSYHAPRGRCVRLYAQRRCGARDTGGAARARATLACEPFRHNTACPIPYSPTTPIPCRTQPDSGSDFWLCSHVMTSHSRTSFIQYTNNGTWKLSECMG